MMDRKTQYGWMAFGAMLCLLGLGIALKVRDNNKAVARADSPAAENTNTTTDAPPAVKEEPKKAEPKTIEPPMAGPDVSPPPSVLPPVTPPPPEAAMPAPAPPSPTGVASKSTPPPVPSPDAPSVVPPLPPLPPPSVTEGSTPAAPPVIRKNPDGPAVPPAPAVGSATLPPPPPDDPPLAPMPPTMPKVPEMIPLSPEPVPAPIPPSAIVPVSATAKTDVGPGEPPLAAVSGPLQMYEVRAGGETIQEVARRTLGAGERWMEIQKLNPALKSGTTIAAGTLVRLPAEACVAANDEIEAIKPLPAMRPKSAPAVVKKLLPLTGTYPCTIEDKHVLTLPKALRDQLGNCETILVSPGPDQCLWITNHAHLERLAERLEMSPAKEMDVRVFKRLYYAQTEKASLAADGTMTISDKLVQFAGLRQDVVLVGIDEHFELWDAAKWRAYTQQKSAEARAMMEHE